MTFIYELKDYGKYLKKYLYIIMSLYVLLEIIVFIMIGRTNVFMFLSSLFVTLYLICSLLLMFKDFKSNILIFILSMPIIPMILYLLYRLNLTWMQSIIYIIYFAVFFINVFKDVHNKNIDFSRKTLLEKNKKIILTIALLLIISIISSIFSTHKFESFALLSLGEIAMFIIALIIISLKESDENFWQRVILYLSIGVVISGIPDTVVALYCIVTGQGNIHLYSVLGSNFMLGYMILVLPYILFYATNRKKCPKYFGIFRLLVIAEAIILSTQISRGMLLTLLICFAFILVVDKQNRKKYAIIGGILILIVAINVSNRWELRNVKSYIDVELTGGGAKTNFISLLLQQSSSRKPIWNATINMIKANPMIGVGLGNFKYHYLSYGGDLTRPYTDAHNIFLTTASELGIPYAIILFGCCFIILLKAIKNVFRKENEININLLLPGIVGMICFFIYGNTTGQAFMTNVYPISIVPAFVFTVILSILIKSNHGDI